MRFFTALTTIVLTSLISCNHQPDTSKLKEKLMQTDRSFSARSKEVGNNQAFIEFAATEAVLLKKNHYPIVGKREIKEHLNSQPDSAYTLTWKPSYARVAESGDLGYTFGIYTLTTHPPDQQVFHGTYVAIWERNKTGKWRFVLDSGNSGLG